MDRDAALFNPWPQPQAHGLLIESGIDTGLIYSR